MSMAQQSVRGAGTPDESILCSQRAFSPNCSDTMHCSALNSYLKNVFLNCLVSRHGLVSSPGSHLTPCIVF